MNYHFNWEKLLEGRQVEDFLASDDLWGQHQDANNPGRRLWRKYLADRLQAGPKVSLLEIGFGSGIDYRALDAAGLLDSPNLDYHGADVTEKFVNYARENFPKIEPHLVDGYHLPFENGRFDVVYIRHVIEHQTHYRFLLSEIFRVCKDEVFLILFIPLIDAETDDIQFDGTWHNNHYSRKLFYAFAEEHGFELHEGAAFHHSGSHSDQLFLCKRVQPVEQTQAATPNPTVAANRPLTVAFGSQHWPMAGRPTEGLGAYVVTTATELARRGHNVHVITCAHPDQPADWVEAGVTVHQVPLPGPNAKDPASLQVYSETVAARFKELDAVHHFDVIEFQDWAAEGWAYRPRPDQLLVIRTNTPSWVVREFEYADDSPAELRVDELERWPLERADLITAPSLQGARRLAERWMVNPAEMVVIPNPVDSEKFKPTATPRPSANPLVLCVNRYTPLKGVEQFVRAAAIVHPHFPQARFRMVGRSGDWNGQPGDQYLRTLARSLGLLDEYLEIPGAISREALAAEYNAADICVNPSLYENVSYTALEALACGRPTIMTSGQGNSEYMSHGEDCLIVPPNDVEQLADAMLTLLTDSALREGMGAAARRTVEQKLSAKAVAESLENIFHSGLHKIAQRPAVEPARLNIAILTHNALDYTKKCLISIATHTPVAHNIFIVDNASTDETPTWLQSQASPNWHVTLSDQNLGVPGGRNRLFHEILPQLPEDGYIVFLDNDVEVQTGWYEPFLKLFTERPEAGVAGAAGHPFIVHEATRQLLPGPTSGPSPVDVVSGFCFWVRAAAAQTVGLFDGKLGNFWHEDDDYCVRAIGLGYEVFAIPGAPVVHHEHKSGAALPDIVQDGSPANQKYLVEKWRRLGFVNGAGRIIHLHPIDSDTPGWSPEVESLVEQADAAFVEGNMERAAEALRQALELAPDHPQLIIAYGNVMLRLGDIDSAEREFRKAVALHPNLALAHSNLAAVQMHVGHNAEAMASACRALVIDPNETQALEILNRLDSLLQTTVPTHTDLPRDPTRPIRIGVDLRTLCYPSSNTRGIGQYTYYHLAALMKQAPDWQFILYLDDPTQASGLDLVRRLAELPNAQIKSTLEINSSEIDLFHIPDPLSLLTGFDSPFRLIPGGPVTAICYDLIPFLFRDEFLDKWEPGAKAAYLLRLKQLSQLRGGLLAISENTRQDFHKYLGIPLERITPIMAGLNSSAKPAADPAAIEATLKKYGLQQPFFLTVGSLEPRKGFETTVNALIQARTNIAAQVAVVGGFEDPWKEAFRHLLEQNNISGVVFTGFISREELEHLYLAATALIFPSHYEGFGFPVLEAMARGCPVITCDNSSLPEVAGEAAIVVKTNDSNEIAGAMVALAKDAKLRAKFVAKGYEQAAKFSWEAVAAKTIAAMKANLPVITPAQPASPAAPAVCWAASMFDYSGYAWLARQTLPVLAAQGAIVQAQPLARNDTFIEQLKNQPKALAFWNDALNRKAKGGVHVFFHPPVSWEGENYFAHFRAHAPEFKAYVGLTMWETDRLPANWAAACNDMDEVWVPSTFNRDTFAFAGVNPALIKVIPFGLDTSVYDPARVKPLEFPHRRGFNFLSVFQWNKRKGWDILLRAYLAAFTAQDDVCLYIRAYPDRIKTPSIQQRIDDYVRISSIDPSDLPAIILLDEFIPEEQMPALFAAADAFVLPTRGEGWGIPYMEAMAMAKPVIATRWSGHLDFMTDANSYLIDIDGLSPVDEEQTLENPFYTADQLWAQPSLLKTAALMRQVYEQREEARQIGRQARQTIVNDWSLERTADWVISRVKELSSRPPAAKRSTPAPTPIPHKAVAHAPSQPPAVIWHAPVFDPSGYADDARSLAMGIDKLGAKVRLNPLTKTSQTFVEALDTPTRQELERLTNTQVSQPYFSIVHAPGYALQYDPDARYNIGRTMFETDRLHTQWVTACNEMDEIWVPTEFNRQTFANAGVTVPLYRIPMGIDASRFRPNAPQYSGIADFDGFKFLSVFEWTYRKGWDVLLRAWAQAFKPVDGVRLFLRTSPLGRADAPDAKQQVESYIAEFYAALDIDVNGVAPIHVIAKPLYRQLPGLYSAANAFVLPSRGEGWGRPYIEAMATGLPVIGTRWSGNLEFMNDVNSLLIDIEGLVAVGDNEELPFYRGHQWAEPSITHLVQRMHQVVADPVGAQALGQRARADVMEHWTWEAASRIAYERLEEINGTRAQATPAKPATKLGVRWEGSQFVHHSLALVNRELCLQLAAQPEFDLSVIPYEPHQFGPEADPRFGLIAERLNKPLAQAAVHVRHQWPPNLTPPLQGHWIMIQPWEFGSLPKDWARVMSTQVDEMWVPSSFVRDIYIASGVPAERVQVVPNGVDSRLFHPRALPLPLDTSKKFKFLFVGGTIWRKGFDLLLEAYAQAFSATDDVCLVVKDMGGTSFYQGQTSADLIREFRTDPNAPEILYLTDDMPPAQLPSLYTACDCLVHPYRGEGFGLPIAEAMACGLPVIATGAGACLDFCNEQIAYLLPARRMFFPENRIGERETVDKPFVYEPDLQTLIQQMKHVAANPAEAEAVGARASQHIHANFGWERAAAKVTERLVALQAKPVVRNTVSSASSEKPLPASTAQNLEAISIVVAEEDSSPEFWRALQHHTPQLLRVLTTPGVAQLEQMESESLSMEANDQSLAQKLNRILAAPGNEPVVLLSSDVIVTPDWLERLVSVLERDTQIAAVGPVSNNAPAPQRIKAKYDGLGRSLRQFAKLNARKHADEVKETTYLGGFCLVFNRRRCREAGLLREDVDFATALWDYWARVKGAGYKLAVAMDAFVHHTGLSEAEGAGYDELVAMEAKVLHAFIEGNNALQAGDVVRAGAIFDELVSAFPDLASGWAALGGVLLAKGNTARAAESLGRAVELMPEMCVWRNQYGVALFQNGKADEAEQVFRATLSIEPENIDALLNLVEMYRAQERYPEAAEHMTRAIGFAPGNPEVLAAFGTLGAALGDAEAIQMALRQLERIAPDHPAIETLKEILVPA